MLSGYFHRVTKQTPTRFWINNPTGDDMEKGIAAGAINVTTNPSYCSKLLQREADYIRRIIDKVAAEVQDDNIAADLVYQKCSARVLDRFLALYKESNGAYGYVTIQDDPREDDDAEVIVEASLRHAKLGPNYMAKIPVIKSGLESIENLIERDMPICATEVFSVAQAIHTCELYQRVSKKCGKTPLFYVTHIAGIFDQHLGNVVKYYGIDIDPEVLYQAGCAVARKEYRLLKERGYKVTMLGGGARGTQHFTEMVGGDIHVTINYSMAQELIDKDEPVVSRIEAQTPPEVIEELREKLPDFRRAYDNDGLAVEEFKDFGPLLLFRSMFLEGYYHLLSEIAGRRALLTAK